jgi:hypothetical protein
MIEAADDFINVAGRKRTPAKAGVLFLRIKILK